jgi:hypothetical protein
MRHPHALMVRYTGTDAHRRFLIQRGDGCVWTGSRFSPQLHDAELFADRTAAQLTRNALLSERYRDKPARTFECVLSFTVTGDEVEGISLSELAKFLHQSIVVNIDSAGFGDGPRRTWVLPAAELGTLTERARPGTYSFQKE